MFVFRSFFLASPFPPSKQRWKTFASYLIQKEKFIMCIRQHRESERGDNVELKMHKDDEVSSEAEEKVFNSERFGNANCDDTKNFHR